MSLRTGTPREGEGVQSSFSRTGFGTGAAGGLACPVDARQRQDACGVVRDAGARIRIESRRCVAGFAQLGQRGRALAARRAAVARALAQARGEVAPQPSWTWAKRRRVALVATVAESTLGGLRADSKASEPGLARQRRKAGAAKTSDAERGRRGVGRRRSGPIVRVGEKSHGRAHFVALTPVASSRS